MTIKDAIIEFLNSQEGRKAHLSKIYEGVRILKGEEVKEASIRNTIEIHSSDSDAYDGKDDIFYSVEGKGKGIWGLREQEK